MKRVAPQASVTPLAGALGVRIEGVDIARDAGAPLVDALRTILDTHLVIHLPGQGDLDPEQHLAFATQWGEVASPPLGSSIEGLPGLVEITGSTEADRGWHQDATHRERPPSVSIALARETPRVGGDSMWANQYRAYEALSPGLRDTLDGLFGVHEGTVAPADSDGAAEVISSVHPVVATHDRAGRQALFVNALHTTRLDGWTREESAPLLQYLFRVAVREELTCRHRWSVGDMVIWDNRATQYCALGDGGSDEPRVLHRVAIVGDVPH